MDSTRNPITTQDLQDKADMIIRQSITDVWCGVARKSKSDGYQDEDSDSSDDDDDILLAPFEPPRPIPFLLAPRPELLHQRWLQLQ